jgi:hypothetical protein
MEDRNRAIRDLADALARLSRADRTGDPQSVRINLGPAGAFSGADAALYFSVDVTPKAAEALADAVDSMNACLSSEQPVGQDGAREWTADALISTYPEMAAEILETFLELDPREVTKDVLDNPQADNLTVNRALDDVFGEIADPYADEDDD